MNRRELLGKAGIALAAHLASDWAAAEQPRATDKKADIDPITSDLSAYMFEAQHRELPGETIEKAKEHILDTCAAMISGSKLPAAHVAMKFAKMYGGQGAITVVGSDLRCGPLEAAFSNGMLAHSDETDDSHSSSHSHPGCAVVPAALAAGEVFRVSGNHFLRAVTLGYDVGTRVTMALGGLDYQNISHRSSHSIAGTFGASVAAGCCASLGPQQFQWLLDYASQQASGIAAWQRDTEHVEKAFVFAGMPARNGVHAALLIQLGATGVSGIFTGTDNFFQALGPSADLSMLTESLGQRFEITRTNLKKWTVGSPIQAPLDAMQALLTEHRFTQDDVDTVVVRMATSETRTVNNREMQDISLQQMMAVMLVDRTVSFAAAHDRARLLDPKIARAAKLITLLPDEQLEALYPKLVAIVDVKLKNGHAYTKRVDAVRGTVANPMSREEVVSKCRDLMMPVLGTVRTSELIDNILHLERVTDIHSVTHLLRRNDPGR